MAEIAAGAVTTADLFRELRTISETVIRLEERVAAVGDHETRIRQLERFRFTLLGASSTVGALAGIASSLLAAKIH